MERRIHSGLIDLGVLDVGDSIVGCDMSQWDHLTRVPQLIADTWAGFFEGSFMSVKAIVGESPMKDWERGFGIIVAAQTDSLQRGEKLIMLRKSQANGFSLYRSVNTRPIK